MSGSTWLYLTDMADTIGFTCTVCVNLVLLGLIRTRARNIGTYKYLMAFFSCYSIFYAIIETILRPVMHIENTTFFLLSRKRFDYSTRLGKINSAFYCACFATSFVLSAVHFIYRYFAACKPDLLRLFNGKNLLLWPLGASIPVTAWASVSYFLYPDTEATDKAVTEVLLKHYGGISRENISYIAYVYYYYEDGVRHIYIKNLLGCFVHYFVMSMTFVVVFYCGFATYKTIQQNRGTSDRTRQLQNQLFKALVLQTLIPSVFMYIPTGVMFITPFLDINLNANANFIVVSSFLYPGVDPLILIIIIRDFRRTLLRILKGDFNGGSSVTNQTSSISNTTRGNQYLTTRGTVSITKD